MELHLLLKAAPELQRKILGVRFSTITFFLWENRLDHH